MKIYKVYVDSKFFLYASSLAAANPYSPMSKLKNARYQLVSFNTSALQFCKSFIPLNNPVTILHFDHNINSWFTSWF